MRIENWNTLENPIISLNAVSRHATCKTKVKDIRITNLNCVFISHININTIRNKFDFLLKLSWAMKIFLWLFKQKFMNLFQQANLLYLVSLQHIFLTELKMEKGYLSILLRISLLNFWIFDTLHQILNALELRWTYEK